MNNKEHKGKKIYIYITFCFGAGTGSEKAKNGRARLIKPFLYNSSLLWPCTSCKKNKFIIKISLTVFVYNFYNKLLNFFACV